MILNAATKSLPLSFPKSKQDVWIRFILVMDGQQEPVRYESNLLFGLESESVSVSLLIFFSGKRKFGRRKGRNKCQSKRK